MLIIKLAIRAFQLEHDRLPKTLDELTPTYLPELPADPFGGSRFGYLPAQQDGYILYSYGPDGDDDRGEPRSVGDREELGDITDAALFNPPVFQPAIGPP